MIRPGKVYPTEHQDQQALVAWIGFQRVADGPLSDFVVMIPNETPLSFIPEGPRRHAYWAKLKSLGFKRGASDMFIALPRRGFNGLWLENKRHRGHFGSEAAVVSAVSDEQRKFQKDMERVGFKALVAYGFEESKAAIQWYLAMPLGPGQSWEDMVQ